MDLCQDVHARIYMGMARLSYGQWLRIERRARALTQKQVEEAAEISHSHYSKLENEGIKLPEKSTRDRIHKVFGTTDDDLVDAGILQKRVFRSTDGEREVTIYGPAEEEDSREEEPLEYDPEALPAHLRTSFMKLGRLSEAQQRLIEQMIEELDAAAEVERRRLREEEP